MRSMFVAILLGMVFAVGCAGRSGRSTRQGETTMPSPEGCFVQVWDAPSFGGVTDYINGPRAYTNLRDLPGARIWADRIRSVKTGVAAAVIVFARENFQGASLRLSPDRDYPTFPLELSGHIASMRIDCPAPSPSKVQ
jgi:hypothetical protein